MTQKILNDLAYQIVGACIEVHKIAGPGLYEKVYHECLEQEFKLINLNFKSELPLPFSYKGKVIDCMMKCDFYIEDLIVLEIKSVSEFHQVHYAQTLNYMNLLKAHRGILVNFNVANIYHEGYKSFAGSNFSKLPLQ